MPNTKSNKNKELLILMVGLFILLTLSLLNIKNYTSVNKVLGIQTEEVTSDRFWKNFLIDNPNYVPGWIESNNTKKAFDIDPNYRSPTK
jgi:hypothetical protein